MTTEEIIFEIQCSLDTEEITERIANNTKAILKILFKNIEEESFVTNDVIKDIREAAEERIKEISEPVKEQSLEEPEDLEELIYKIKESIITITTSEVIISFVEAIQRHPKTLYDML